MCIFLEVFLAYAGNMLSFDFGALRATKDDEQRGQGGLTITKLTVVELISARDAWGGIEQYALNLVRMLQQRGHTLYVAARPVERFTERYAAYCPVYTFPIKGSLDFGSINGLAKLIREKQVEIIHTHTSRDAWLALFATWRAGRGKVVMTRHMPFPAKRGLIHKLFYHQLAAIICVSQYVKGQFLSSLPNLFDTKVSVIYPGIAMDKFAGADGSKTRQELGLAANDFLIGYIGRITWEKGLDSLLEAARLLKQAIGPCFKLVLVGTVNPNTPNYQNELQAKATFFDISALICFYGFATEVPQLLKAFNVLVLPSVTTETFGLVLCEAMACGKPVIATTTGGPAEIVQHRRTGLLIPPDAPVEMAAGLQELATNRALATEWGQAGQKLVRELFDMEIMIERMEQVFDNSRE
jgi:glycosyltransferase involved in cell wall biosynthesis